LSVQIHSYSDKLGKHMPLIN